jgi:hypothetical protein
VAEFSSFPTTLSTSPIVMPTSDHQAPQELLEEIAALKASLEKMELEAGENEGELQKLKTKLKKLKRRSRK